MPNGETTLLDERSATLQHMCKCHLGRPLTPSSCLHVMGAIDRKYIHLLDVCEKQAASRPPTRFWEEGVRHHDPESLVGAHDSPFDQVQPARRVNHPRDLAGLERKGCVLKLLLHVSPPKVAKVATLPGAAAVGLGQSQLAQRDLSSVNPRLVVADNLLCFALGARDLGLAVRSG